MSEVSVEINGRKYRMACEDGQEEHLHNLARRFDTVVDGFKGDFGEIGDTRLTVMAGIAVMDTLSETEAKLAQIEGELKAVTEAGEALAVANEELELKFAQRMSDTARTIENVATVIETASEEA